MKKFTALFIILAICAAPLFGCADKTVKTEAGGNDENTVSLWLFDEVDYKHATMLDASKNEMADLTLMEGGHLVKGKFGNALRVTPDKKYAVSYSAYKGAVSLYAMRSFAGPSGLLGPTESPMALLETLSQKDYTIEFWLNFLNEPSEEAVLFDTGYAFDKGYTITYSPKSKSIAVENYYTGKRSEMAFSKALLKDNWIHIAITSSANGTDYSLYLNGMKAKNAKISSIEEIALPDSQTPKNRHDESRGMNSKTPLEERIVNRYNLTIGQSRSAEKSVDGFFDEFRISNTVRYTENFNRPGSFSTNYNESPRPETAPSGLPLLFGDNIKDAKLPDVYDMTSRRHLFIDEMLIGKKSGDTAIKMNSPYKEDSIKISDMVGKNYLQVSSFVQTGNSLTYYCFDQYGGTTGTTRAWTSTDNGLTFASPKDVITGSPMSGMVFYDKNPQAPESEKYKMTAWVANRGISMFTSPDGYTWRRTETNMLPFVSGGESEMIYDDQKGVYTAVIKRDPSYNAPDMPELGYRAGVAFDTKFPFKGWKFTPLKKPYFEGWTMPAICDEGEVRFRANAAGQVYRSRPVKYEFAPDVYLSFVWRFIKPSAEFPDLPEYRQVDLGVSRDGINWAYFTDLGQGFYIDNVDSSGNRFGEFIIATGMLRDADNLYQWGEYGGFHGGIEQRSQVRLTQRLDGFVSIDAANGSFETKPITFKEGSKLSLNIASKGAKVAFVDESGKEIEGFALSDSDTIKADSTDFTVTWKGNSDISALKGQTVRLKVVMSGATKLYAFEIK